MTGRCQLSPVIFSEEAMTGRECRGTIERRISRTGASSHFFRGGELARSDAQGPRQVRADVRWRQLRGCAQREEEPTGRQARQVTADRLCLVIINPLCVVSVTDQTRLGGASGRLSCASGHNLMRERLGFDHWDLADEV